MGRFKRRMYDRYQSEDISSDEQYNMAYKRVKRIKGFYIHAFVYVLVNTFILISIFSSSSVTDKVFWERQTWNTFFLWGIGVLTHGLSIFGKYLFFGSDWKHRKIQEFMDEHKNAKWE